MPYIKQERRVDISLKGDEPATPGELNYGITSLCAAYWDGGTKSYQTLNDIIGALEAAKLEFYRRIVVPYENSKMTENGDVYD